MATGGLALSLALATNFEMCALLWLLHRKIGSLTGPQESLLVPILKITVAADIMAAVLWVSLHFLNPVLAEADKFGVILLTLGLIGLGAVTYAGVSLVLGVSELKSAVRRFRR
jgi:peptidoglycan biosynthesis protein MviN/MurJ (putative lipid II flippase)